MNSTTLWSHTKERIKEMEYNYCVVPLDDLFPHDKYSEGCACWPRVEEYENGAKLYIHNSFDGREKEELLVKKYSEAA